MALTKFNYNSFDVTPVASTTMAFNSGANGLTTMSAGAMTLIKTVTASADSTISFANGTSDVVLDSTYPIYKFVYTNVHAGTDNVTFHFGLRDGSTAYDAVKTTTAFNASHNEAGTAAELIYRSGDDLAQATGFQDLGRDDAMGTGNDESLSGELYLFNPSSTTFVKHFLSRNVFYHRDDAALDFYTAGYANTTTAIDGVQFKMSSGNVDAGTFKLYGIKDS